MQYEINDSNLLVNISNGADIDAVQNIAYIKSGEKEIEDAVENGINQIGEAVSAYIQVSKDWAVKMNGKINGEDYSSKYYATQAADIMTNGVIATGTTTSRTLQNRFADVVNVKDFGAVGDGTTDDTAAINSAYDAANTKSAKVFFPAGTYLTTDNISRFLSVIAVGDGKIKRGSNIFDIGENQDTNNLYVSVDGTGDGLSVDYPTTRNKMSRYLQKKAVITNQLILNFAAGTYSAGYPFKDVHVSKIDGLIFRGVEPDRVNNTWTTIFQYPLGGSTGAALMISNVSNANVENMEFIGPGTSSGTSVGDYDGIYFAKDVNRGKVVNCKFDDFPYGIGVSVQECVTVQIFNNIFNNCNRGFYVYNSVGSSLIDDGTRNKFTNCQHALYVTGASYMHNDHNDFEDCHHCVYLDKGAYCGWNDCTKTNCDIRFKVDGCSISRFPAVTGAEGIFDRVFVFGNTVGTDYELYKQGVYLPNGGVNGSWSFGFKTFYSTDHPVIYNVSSSGDDCTKRGDVDTHFVLTQSTDSKAGFAVLTDQSTSAHRGGFYCYDENGTYGMSGISAANNTLNVWVDGSQHYQFLYNIFRPSSSGDIKLGSPSYLWAQVYAANGTINTSDERQKQDIDSIDEAVFRAWEKVDFKQFKFKDAVEKKGENARVHIGLIAQKVKAVFEAEGLDAFKYGLLCYDEWEAEPEQTEDDGTVISPAKEAGNAYGIRYNEALALECAYQRWKLEQMQECLPALKAR